MCVCEVKIYFSFGVHVHTIRNLAKRKGGKKESLGFPLNAILALAMKSNRARAWTYSTCPFEC